MLRWSLVTFLGLAACLAQAEIRWFGNAARASEAAKRERKLIMLDLRNEGVQGGRALDQALGDPRVAKAAQAVVPLRLKAASDGKSYVRKYRVAAYPTVLFLTPDGKAVWRVSGPHGPDSFTRQIRKALGMQKALPSIAGGGASVEALAGSAVMAASSNDPALAQTLARRALAKDPKVESVRLADAFNLIGDCYQNANKPAQAIPFFKRAANSTNDDTKAYALVSIGSCYSMLRDNENAMIWFRKLADMGPRAGDMGDGIREFLKRPQPRPRGRAL